MYSYGSPHMAAQKQDDQARTYIQQLCEDTGCCPEDLPRAMNDREEWRERVRDIRATSAIWWWFDGIYPWCNGYCHWKWKLFKSCTRPFAFRLALIPLGKVCIQLFSIEVNSRTDQVLQPWCGNWSRRKTLNSNLLNCAWKNWPCVLSCSYRGLDKYIYIFNSSFSFSQKCIFQILYAKLRYLVN